MKQVLASALEGVLNAFYRAASHGPRQNLVGFLSRQSNTPSEDFRRLGTACEELDGWSVAYLNRMLEGGLGAKVSYLFHMLSEVRLLARCRICFVEGYNPTLSMLHLKSEGIGSGIPNTTAPTEPVVIQLWHASGAFKKFGYQTLGTAQGRSLEDARVFHMHRNYSWVVCSGESVRGVYAEALGYPRDRVVALGRASDDALFDPAERERSRTRVKEALPALVATDKPVVLLAPTLRRGDEPRPFDGLRAQLEGSDLARRCELVWSDHPVVERDKALATSDLMRVADLVVTDYSSVVYDAAQLEIPFAFYVPDIEAYRVSPGLNADPVALSPDIAFTAADDLARFIGRFAEDPGSYPTGAARAFVGDDLSASGPGASRRILDFALAHAGSERRGE